jgi:hypothetical protein
LPTASALAFALTDSPADLLVDDMWAFFRSLR